MIKNLPFLSRHVFATLALTFALFSANNSVFAQCGPSPFNEGGTVNPAINTWNTVNVGSGTFLNVNVNSGNIYSFRYGSSALLGYEWDMTLSTTSASILYNNSLTPTKNPYTGGLCNINARPNSTDWYADFSGVLRVNTKSWNGACNNYVPGQGSASLQYKACPPAADPGPGINQWNVDVFATTDLAIPNPAARYGFYTQAGLNFNTAPSWGGSGNSPSQTAGWVGCEVPLDMFVVRGRRQGFNCDRYVVNVVNANDAIEIFINGTSIYSAPCCINSNTVVGDPNGYVLNANDVVEVRFNAVCAGDAAEVTFTAQSVVPIDGGVIGGVANNADICENTPIGFFTNVTPGSGGSTGFNNGGVISYSWEISSDNGVTFVPVPGVTTPDWNSPTLVPPGATYIIRRRSTDKCGNTDASNAIVVTGRPTPNGSLSPVTQNICPGTNGTITLNLSPGTGPFNIQYTDGVSNFSRTGKNNGDTIQVAPLVTTNYLLTSIQDVYGCVRTSGFNGGAQVIVNPSTSLSSVNTTSVLCNGGNTGSITITATGGTSPLEYSIDGGSNYFPSNIFTGLTSGFYNVTVRDGFGCITTWLSNPVFISEPTDVVHTTTTTDASCANVFDGSIDISASGGVAPYSYTLNNGPSQIGNVFNGLGANTYLVTVIDDNGCLDTSSATIGNTYIIAVNNLNQTNVSCAGGVNGSVTVQVNGGIPPYAYSINGISFQPSGTFNGLSAGTYIITGRDSKGCTEFVTVSITEPAPLYIQIDSVSNVLCNGTTSGAIYITANGGTPGYTYLWSNGAVSEDNTTILAGIYNVTVSDANSCTAQNGASVTEPLSLSLNIAQFNNLLCSGDSSGAIDVTANGGVSPYSYAWSNGASTEDIVNLQAGNYTVTVSDDNGCSSSIAQLIASPTPLTSSVSGVDVLCNGQASGSADLTVNGGTFPYFYQWSNFQATQDVSGLSGGLYYVIITDVNGCQQRDSVFVGEPAALVLTLTPTPITCFNANDGAVDLSVAGGVVPYSYNWSNGAATEDISGLSGNTYIVTVTDDNGCSATASVLIVNPPAINTSYVINDALCFGQANGSIDLIPSGGTPAYTYNWSNGAATEDLTNVAAGTYVLTITDSKGCERVDSVVVTEPAALVTSGFIKNVSCNALCDGFIDVTAYGGTLPYAFAWSNGPSTEDIGQVCGGNYFVTVTDVNNCTVASLYVVNEPAPLSVDVVGSNIACYNSCTGTLAAVPSGGTTPYAYLWESFQVDSSLSGVCAGKHTVLVTDSNGCQAFDTLDLTQPDPIVITGVVVDAKCFSATDGSIDISVNGGVPAYTYVWSNAVVTEDNLNIGAGTYTVSVSDVNLCQATASFTVNQPLGLFATLSKSNPVCFGGNNGFLSVDISGGTNPYSYVWSTLPVQNGNIATNLKAGNYTVTITDAIGCTLAVAADLDDPDQIIVTATGTDARCYNTPTGGVSVSATGGVAPYVYELNGLVQVDTFFGELSPGQYIVLVTDVNGCTGSDVFNIQSPSQVTVDLVAPQFVILQGMSTQIIANSVSTSPIVNHFWGPADSISIYDFSACGDPANCATPYASPYFTSALTVTVMNADSCFASDTVIIIVETEEKSFVPSAFSPNGDGLNDFFEFDFLGATNLDISIWNRWGEAVYVNPNQPNGITGSNGWDGRKGGDLVPVDTYVYQLKVTYFNGLVKEKSGTVTITK